MTCAVVVERRGGRPKALSPLKPYTIRLDDELLAEVCREARRQVVTPQVIMRVALRRFLAQPEKARTVRERR